MTSIIKSQSDNRTYKHIELPNKLQCLLISDLEADKSAAALDVKVGASLDPKPLYGTAHFLEHMLFMGTEKYPSENEYSEFIKNSGGYNNASTSLTNTNYHFECSNEAFPEALDRFAQFFIAPLLGEGSAEREMKAVDSEFNMFLQSDPWKFYSIVQENAHQESSLNRFHCGNLETLKQDGIREALLKFHQTWYSANIMKLIVTGNHDLEKLEQLAHSLFAQVPNKDIEVPSFAEPKCYDERNLGQLITFVPVKDKDILTLTWFLPYTELEYKTTPLSYHSNLFGHEGENSLLSFLIEQGLALELSSSFDHELSSFTNFNIDITLTKKGLAEYEKIIEAVFQYAQIVRNVGAQRYLFDETKRVGEIKFDFADKKSGINYCVSLAGRLQKFQGEALKDILKHVYVTEEFDAARIQEMSNLIADPAHLNIYLRSKSFEGKTDLQEQWFKTKYSKQNFSQSLLDRIRSPNVDQPKKKLGLPPPNLLLPKNLDVLAPQPELSSRPVLIQQWEETDLWYMKDDKFKRPKAIIQAKYYTNDCMFGRTSVGRVFIELWTNIVKETLREYNYQASMATLNSNMSVYHDNLNLDWTGFNDTLPLFVEETLRRIQQINWSEQRASFDQVKEKLTQEWTNFYLEQSFRQAFSTFETIVVNQAVEKKTLKKILQGFTFEQFLRLSGDWLKTGRMVWFVHGNISKEAALGMVEVVRSVLKLQPVDREDLVDVRCIALQKDVSLLLELPLDDRTNENSCLVAYFEVGLEGTDLRTKMIHDVVMSYLDEPTFNQLRTHEQLGYAVFCRNCTYRDVIGSQFIIQSPGYSCEYVVNSLNNFLKTMIPRVEALTVEEFKVQVDSVMVTIAEKDYNLGKENGRFWGEISTHKYMFDRQEKEIEVLKNLTKDEFAAHFNRIFFSDQTKRFDVEFTSEKHIENQKEFKGSNLEKHFTGIRRHEVTESLSAFKKKMGLHPDLFQASFATFKL